MDLSIVAAIGSFVVSERMIRPKLLVVVGLGLLLIHDLATHSNDPASLRIYRGELPSYRTIPLSVRRTVQASLDMRHTSAARTIFSFCHQYY